MAVNVTNAYVSTPPIDGGVFYSAPLGTALPTDATTALTSTFLSNDHGAIGEDGITVTQKRDTKDIKMFGGGTFINVQDNYDEMLELTLLEDDNINVVNSVFGAANVTVTPASSTKGTQKKIYHTDAVLPIRTYVAQTVSGTKKKRYVIERGQITEVAEIKNVHNDVTSYKITVKTYKSSNSAVNYANTVEHRDDGVTTTV